jgi:hypothetical protein
MSALPVPTGNPPIAPVIQRYIKVNDDILNKSAARDIDDTEEDESTSMAGDLHESDIEGDHAGDGDDDEVVEIEGPVMKKAKVDASPASTGGCVQPPKSYIARHASRTLDSASKVHKPRSPAVNATMMSNLNAAIDPERQAQRDESRSMLSFQTAEIMRLKGENSQLQRENSRLRDKLLAMQRQCDQQERRREQAEQTLNMMQMMRNMFGMMAPGGMRGRSQAGEMDTFTPRSRNNPPWNPANEAPVASGSNLTVNNSSLYDELEPGDRPLEQDWEPTQRS